MIKVNNGAVLEGLFLFTVSENHNHYSVTDFFQYFVYPLMYNKARLYRDEAGKPIGVFTYCFLSKEKAEAFLNEEYTILEEDYIADDGDEIWGVEFIAPYGHAKQMVADLKREYAEKYGQPRPVFWRRLDKPYERRRGKL
jgi:cytolysin-activating lysine-acyltransferase